MRQCLRRRASRAALFCAVAVSFCLPSLRAEEPFDYFHNSWNVIGLKDYIDGTRITPNNELLLAGGGKVALKIGEKRIALSREQTKTLYEGWMPIILLTARDGDVRYDFTFWATPLPTVKDWQKAFDWPTEGENFANWIAVKATNTGAKQADANIELDFTGKSGGETRTHGGPLAPNQSEEFCERISFAPGPDAGPWHPEDTVVWKQWLARTADYWRGALAGAAKIEVPCRKASDALKAAHVCQLIANDHGTMHGGEGFYDEFFVRDGAYQIMEIEEAGFGDASAKAIEAFVNCQKPDGHFETQDNELDGNGQGIWALWQYAKITGDRAWLEKVFPQMLRACRWTMTTRRQAPADSPYPGLLPAAFADGEFLYDRKHHIVGYDLWNLRGLLCTADAARQLGKDAEAKELSAEAEDYRKAIDAACKRTGVDFFPPSWEKDGTFWGNTETLWPTPLLAADDPRVTATIRQAREKLGGGFTEGTIHWVGLPEDAIHPYMSAYTTMASLNRGEDEQVVEDFYWYLLHSTAAHAFPEGIHYKRQFAWGDTIPHVTGASNYAILLRHMLVHEQGDELHLLAAVPDWWLGDGQEIRVKDAPTYFGPLSLSVRGTAAGVEVQFTKPVRNPPKRIVLHLPKSRPLVGTLAGLEVVQRPDQKTRWDFPTVIKKYLAQKPPSLPAKS